ncbi:MAG: cellulase family glycosylhydrolase, partial [Acidobacteriota bacterium]|nr:cellulase family glycosylhydrolase [Acidobacteriota bacterium]
ASSGNIAHDGNAFSINQSLSAIRRPIFENQFSYGLLVSGFVGINSVEFTLDGQPFRFAGANNYYLGNRSKAMADAVLDRAAAMGLQVIRTWGFLDAGPVCYQHWDSAAGAPAYNDGRDGLERLDYAVEAAKARGMKLILPLVNNWKDFGGIDQYVAWFGLTRHSDFYTNANARQAYQAWVSHLLNRRNTYTGVLYKDEPAIMAWELTNELRSSRGDTAATTGWVAEMSSFVKQMDSTHLVAAGDEGLLDRRRGGDWLYNGSQGVDFDAILGISTIDFGTFHSYPENWGKDAAWGARWIEDHLVSASKPVLLEEYGWKDRATRDSVFASWLEEIFERGAPGDLVWMLAGTQDDGSLYPDYDGYTIYGASDAPSIVAHSARIRRGRDAVGAA